VVEGHPDHPFPDLRILQPPAALRTLVDTKYLDLTALSSHDFSHTPWVVLLIKAVDAWRAANDGALPSVYKQKKEVKAVVESFRRPDLQADVNIDEALAAVNTALNTPSPSSSVAAILRAARSKVSAMVAEQQQSQMASEEDGSASSSGLGARKGELAFWVMAAATQSFVEQEGSGLLPVIGTIPDMTADTSTYVALQQLYAQQAATDLAAVQAHAREIAAAEGIAPDPVSTDELKRFCKNAHGTSHRPHVHVCMHRHPCARAHAAHAHAQAPACTCGCTPCTCTGIQLFSYRSLADEYSGEASESLSSALSSSLASGDAASAASLYLLLRAARVRVRLQPDPLAKPETLLASGVVDFE
jgi:hypothetical protein